MGTMSIWHWLIVLIVVLLIFGSGKISTLMGDLAKGIKVFKKNMAEDESALPSKQDNPKQDNKSLPASVSGAGGTQPDVSVPFHEEKTHSPVSSGQDTNRN